MDHKAECVKCGKVYTAIEQLKDVHSVGLALGGTCPECGGRVWCGEMWNRREVKQSAAKESKGKHKRGE